MTPDDLDSFSEWFNGYSCSFVSEDSEVRNNIALKQRHTREVCRNMLRIAEYESLDEVDTLIARAVALLHDVGRFPQFYEFRTFQDRKSVNHGELGARVLMEKGVLAPLRPREQELILDVVKYHNTYSIPALEDQKKIFFLRLIRDADKLDIWRVFLDYMSTPPDERSAEVGMNLPDTAGYSREVLSALENGKVVSLSLLKSLNDLKLMLMSWIYDLNFGGSYRILEEKHYLESLRRELPEDDNIHAICERLSGYIKSRLKG